MHLLIDVRTSSLSDIPTLYYAELWADMWMRHHPDDRITFLAYEWDPVWDYECIYLSRKWSLWPKWLAAHDYGPDRIISFSKSPQIDTSIPMILHVFELTSRLYPHHSMNYWWEKKRDIQYKNLLRSAQHIIIPDHSVGSDLGELYGIDEAKMSVIPYLSPTDQAEYSQVTLLPHGISWEYYLSEATPHEEWNPTGLILMYAKYLKKNLNPPSLVILGDIGSHLSTLSGLIRSLGIIEHVKIIGILTREERATLYVHAKGWIYTGPYYSRGASIALASGYGIPLYLSDIWWLREYSGIHIHPNRADTLADILSGSYERVSSKKKPENALIMWVYARIIAD